VRVRSQAKRFSRNLSCGFTAEALVATSGALTLRQPHRISIGETVKLMRFWPPLSKTMQRLYRLSGEFISPLSSARNISVKTNRNVGPQKFSSNLSRHVYPHRPFTLWPTSFFLRPHSIRQAYMLCRVLHALNVVYN